MREVKETMGWFAQAGPVAVAQSHPLKPPHHWLLNEKKLHHLTM